MIHESVSDTVVENLTRTFLTQHNTVRTSNPWNLERFLNLDGKILTDLLLSPSFLVDKFKETLGELGFLLKV